MALVSVSVASPANLHQQPINKTYVAPTTGHCTGKFEHIYHACYLIGGQNMKQEDAQSQCEWPGADLLYIEERAEYDAIVAWLKEHGYDNNYYWTSLKLNRDNYVWSWVLGKGVSMTYANWCLPSTSNAESCKVDSLKAEDAGMAIGPKVIEHAWSVQNINKQLPFICKTPEST